MRIWYQSFVDEKNGATYWQHLRADLAQVTDPGTEVQLHGITPMKAMPIRFWRCAVRAR